MAHVPRTDKREPVLSFHHMGSGTELSSMRLDGKCSYPLSHFSSLGRERDLKENLRRFCRAWWFLLVIPALEELRLEDCELEASLSYLVKSY